MLVCLLPINSAPLHASAASKE